MGRKIISAIRNGATLVAAIAAGINLAAATSRGETIQTANATVQALHQWQEMRFGMFIHWGPVALRGTEIGWSRGDSVPAVEYDELYKQFNPTEFDADAWARIAKDAGMKYLVITTKHHDGFCLWPTKYSEYHIGNTPFKRDVVGELAAACRREDVKFATYYSLPDWRGPDYPLVSPGGSGKSPHPNMPRHFQLIKDQARELIESYGPLELMWFDGHWEDPWTPAYGDELYDYLKELQPTLLVNNRVNKEHPPSGSEGQPWVKGDFDTPEQRVGGFDRERPWESCITICHQWAWKPDDQLKSLSECLHTLLHTIGGDGNLLLNVGPMPDGRIEPRQVERLQELGAWVRRYADGIYGTRGGPYKPGEWGAATCRDNRIYLFIMDWPDEGPLVLPPLGRAFVASRTLSGGAARLAATTDALQIELPTADRDAIVTVVELTVEGQAFEIEPCSVKLASGSLAAGQPTTASNTFQNDPTYGPAAATDDDRTTRWATDGDATAAWLEVDLGVPTTIRRVAIDEPSNLQRIEAFQIEAFDGKQWKAFAKGGAVGPRWTQRVPDVSASRVRLTVQRASDGPTINEFQVFDTHGELATAR